MDEIDQCSGAVLSFGKSWESVCPVVFDSMSFKGTEINYLVHEKELLAIICALRKWQVNLLGSPFVIYTNHKTLENFNSQKNLSCHQSRWMKIISQFNMEILYIKGKDNSVADALPCFPSQSKCTNAEKIMHHLYTFCKDEDTSNTIASVLLPKECNPWQTATSLTSLPAVLDTINTTLKVTADKTSLDAVKSGYAEDAWCKTLPYATHSWPGLVFQDGLWYVGD